MANLLYKQRLSRCGLTRSGDAISAYFYGWDDGEKDTYSMFADLEPNTTYTIQRLDRTGRFRIATFTDDVKYLKGSNQRNYSVDYYNIGCMSDETQCINTDIPPITFTTGDNDIYLVVMFTGTASYTPTQLNCRIMLNEGDTIQPYEAPTQNIPHMGIWTVSDGRLVHDDLPDRPTGNYIQPPYPSFWWYVDNGRLVNSNLPAPVVQGAFANCTLLETAHIPESVKSIGEYSFRNTALESVKIASDCTYSVTSFPENCEIEYYSDPENESEGDNNE